MARKTRTGKIIQGRELRAKKRTPLQDVIPLSTPFLIFIEPTNLCNFRCKFCPTSDRELLRKVGRPAGSMSLALFKKIVDDLREFDKKLKLANVYKDGEPLLNKHFPEMARYLRDANVAERIWTKTNGSLLNPELNQRLIDSGLDTIYISVESVSTAGYRKIAQVHQDYEKLRENVADLFARRKNCRVIARLINVGLTEKDKEKFYADFRAISDFVTIENLMGWSYSGVKDFMMGTKTQSYDGVPIVEKEICAYPFYVLAVNFNGTVSVCNEDWSHSTIVGDVRKESLKAIWNSDALYSFQMMHLDHRRRENRSCGDCYCLKIVTDNIDPFRDQIVAGLRESRNRRKK